MIDAHRDLRNQEQTVSILKKEEVTVKTGDNKVYMKQTILIMSASVCILYATWKRKNEDIKNDRSRMQQLNCSI
ncbi:hypothetical protein M5E84_01695 [[Ruminococcus] torques]|nr:hypothetical protein M5E84_01695 [[Ruminococcus] torques]